MGNIAGSIKNILKIQSVIAAVMLAGCVSDSSLQAQEPTQTQQDSQTVSDRQSKLVTEEPKKEEKTDLPAEILYEIMLAEIALQRGDIKTAIQQYIYAAQSSRDLEVIERAAQISVYARDVDATIIIVELWTEIDPGNLEAQQIAAAMYVKKGEIEKARQHLEVIIKLAGQDQNTFLLISSLLSKESDKETALKVMSEIVAGYPENADAQFAYAQLALVVGDVPEALSASERAIKLRPGWTEAIILNCNILFRQDKTNLAFSRLQKHIEQNPDNVELRNYYARRLIDDEKYDEAREQYAYLLEQYPQDDEKRRILARLDYQINNYEDATENFEQLTKNKKHADEAWFYLGSIALHEKQTDDAIEYYLNVKAGVYYVEAQIRLALLEANDGQLQPALNRLHAIQPEDIKTEIRLIRAEGDILVEKKMYQEAFDLYSEALARMKDDTELLYSRALVAEKIDRVDVTISDLRRLLEVDPDNVQALNALGYTLVDKTDKVDEGMGYILRAYEQQPEDPAILDSVGWGYYRQGNNEEALKFLRMAYDKTQDAEIAAHLGEVLWVSGEEDEARSIWQEALQETPSHKVLLEVIKRFTE